MIVLLTIVMFINGKILSTVNKISFSEWLNNELIRNDMSQADLAKKSKLTTGAVSNYINQIREPSPEALNAIAIAFGKSPEEVFRIAGLLPEKPPKDTLTEEAEYLLSQMPETKRLQAINFIRFLAQDKGDHNAAERVEQT